MLDCDLCCLQQTETMSRVWDGTEGQARMPRGLLYPRANSAPSPSRGEEALSGTGKGSARAGLDAGQPRLHCPFTRRSPCGDPPRDSGAISVSAPHLSFGYPEQLEPLPENKQQICNMKSVFYVIMVR